MTLPLVLPVKMYSPRRSKEATMFKSDCNDLSIMPSIGDNVLFDLPHRPWEQFCVSPQCLPVQQRVSLGKQGTICLTED